MQNPPPATPPSPPSRRGKGDPKGAPGLGPAALLTVLLVLLLTGCASRFEVAGQAAETGGVGRTQVIVFAPKANPSQAVPGYCWTRSLAVSRDGAWRCMVVNRIYDPCFSRPDDSSSVICAPDPRDESKDVKMDLTRPLPTGSLGTSRQHAWALELADGTVCTFITGATAPIEGERLNYGCSNDWVIAGDPSPGQVWTAKTYLLKPRSIVVEQSSTATVRTVWE